MRGEVVKKTPKKEIENMTSQESKVVQFGFRLLFPVKIEYIPLTNNVDPIKYFTRKIIIKVV